jgi:hypothetical protein
MDPAQKRRAVHEMRGVVRVVAVMNFPAHDLAAMEVEDEVKGNSPTSTLAGGLVS